MQNTFTQLFDKFKYKTQLQDNHGIQYEIGNIYDPVKDKPRRLNLINMKTGKQQEYTFAGLASAILNHEFTLI